MQSVSLDKQRGELPRVAGPVEGTRGDRFVHLQGFLRTGQLFGMPGRGSWLAVTGMRRWLQTRHARKRAAVVFLTVARSTG